MIEYLPVSYIVLVSSPNGLVVVVTDSRTVDHCMVRYSLAKKNGFLISVPRPYIFEKIPSFKRLVNGRYSSRRRIVWSLLSTNINQPCHCRTSSLWYMEVIP